MTLSTNISTTTLLCVYSKTNLQRLSPSGVVFFNPKDLPLHPEVVVQMRPVREYLPYQGQKEGFRVIQQALERKCVLETGTTNYPT